MRELPAELTGIYKGLLDRIDTSSRTHQDYARLAISWIIGAKISLKTDKFVQAVIAGLESADAVQVADLNVDDILTACQGLVVQNRELDTLDFGHISVLEFVQKEKDELYNYHQVHNCIATACIRTLYGMVQIYHSDGSQDRMLKRHKLATGLALLASSPTKI